MKLSAANLPLQSHQSAPRWLIGYSGGVDSRVLLQLLVQLREQAPATTPELLAIHIDHQLQAQSGDWAQHCQRVCAGLGVNLIIEAVSIEREGGESLEALARGARYRVFEKHLQTDDVLLLAHHLDDQLETWFQRLLRGSGSLGLAAMAGQRNFGAGLLLRPLLDIPKSEILAFARLQELEWVEDPSNLDTGFSRNFLRRELLPKLEQHWPQYRQTLSRSLGLAQESAQLNRELAASDCQQAHVDPHARVLPLEKVQLLSVARQKNLLRFWLQELGLPLPSLAQLQVIVDEVIHAAVDAEPLLKWGGFEIHRFRDQLHVLPELADFDPQREYHWQPGQALKLDNNGSLIAEPISAQGMKSLAAFTVRYRSGGERCQPAGRGHSQTLKKLFQEYAVPTWLRDRVPLIYDGDQLAAVANYWVCESYLAQPGEAGINISWNNT